MPRHRVPRCIGLLSVALLVTMLSATQAQAGNLTFSVNLRTGVGDQAVPPYITYEVPPEDANADGWFETVLRINLNGSPYNEANFRVVYGAEPTGSVNVNIGDSRTNDSGGGDAGTQSNDAEISVGRQETDVNRDLFIHGKDGTPVPVLAQVPNFAGNGVVADFTVRNDFFAWNNNQGSSGSLTSPYLFALAGQPDSVRSGQLRHLCRVQPGHCWSLSFRFWSGTGRCDSDRRPRAFHLGDGQHRHSDRARLLAVSSQACCRVNFHETPAGSAGEPAEADEPRGVPLGGAPGQASAQGRAPERNPAGLTGRFIRWKRAAGLKRGGRADSIGSCVKGLPTRRSACPPACCITPSASAATSTPAPTTRMAKPSSPSTRSPRRAAARPAARPRSTLRGHVERRFRTVPIGCRAPVVVLPVPRVACSRMSSRRRSDR